MHFSSKNLFVLQEATHELSKAIHQQEFSIIKNGEFIFIDIYDQHKLKVEMQVSTFQWILIYDYDISTYGRLIMTLNIYIT